MPNNGVQPMFIDQNPIQSLHMQKQLMRGQKPVLFVPGSQCALCDQPAVINCQGIYRITNVGCFKAVCEQHTMHSSHVKNWCTKSNPCLCIECGVKDERQKKIVWSVWIAIFGILIFSLITWGAVKAVQVQKMPKFAVFTQN